eukprot:CAMPEP_0116834856 /NCGR_PEP_ID=MMETSP0418-20121206/7219_1 /TAXON_ID=1158023 /ORGANISM="Astrosyne radiata, Strain 13vi08-1A" /LENGTH=39 /DNA_ID= /DNA_START= /DNA_END= /DNA_ORIENTATION=
MFYNYIVGGGSIDEDEVLVSTEISELREEFSAELQEAMV